MGEKLRSGYGYLSFGGRTQLAHRMAYFLTYGVLPDGPLDHVKARGCAYVDCCEPTHLEPVTPQENARRALKTHCKRGHLLTIENLKPSDLRIGVRRCLICVREYARLYNKGLRRSVCG